MADNTPIYNFWLPVINGDDGAWGLKLNQNWTDLDAYLKSMQDSIDAGGGGGGSGSSQQYQFSDDTVAAPAAGFASANHADPVSTTLLRINLLNTDSNNLATFLASITVGDLISYAETGGLGAYSAFRVLLDGVAVASHYEYSVETIGVDPGEFPVDLATMEIGVQANPARLLPSGGALGDMMEKASADDYDIVWVDPLTKFAAVAHTHAHADTTGQTTDDHHAKLHAHDGADGSGTVAHSATTGITADDHHAESHSHDSHTGIGVDDHHAQIHDHSTHTNIGTDDHHAKAHVHDGVDGSGTIPHSATTGQGVDDHHAQVHLLYGTDHDDVDSGGSPAMRHTLAWDGTDFGLDYRTKLVPYLGGQTYYPQETVFVDGYLSSALVETTDYPAPVPVGVPANIYLGLAPSAPASAKQIIFGNRYTWSVSGYLDTYRVRTTAGNNYTLYSVSDPLGTPIVAELSSFTADATGWLEISVPQRLILAGAVFDLIAVVSEPDPTPTTWNGDWNYSTPVNLAVPIAGQIIHANNALQLLRVHKTDNAAGDRGAELLALTVGDIIETQGLRWSIQSITDAGTYVTFGIAPGIQAAADALSNFLFETVAATPITRMEDVNWWATNGAGQVQGMYIEDGEYSAITPNNNAYGTDIHVVEATLSADWAIFGVPGGGGGGGGGDGGDFTPTVFTGAGTTGYVPDSLSETGKVMFDDSSWVLVYTQAQADAAFSGINHDHDGTYSPVAHDHTDFIGAGSRGFVPDSLTETGRFLQDDGSWSDVNVVPQTGISTEYIFSDSVAGSPATGVIAVDNADQTLATEIHINDITDTGSDATPWIENFQVGDYLGIEDTVGGDNVWYRVTSAAVDESGWWTVPVAYESGLGGVADGVDVSFLILSNPDNRMPPFGEAGYELVKASSVSYDTAWTPRWQFDFVDMNNALGGSPAYLEGRMFYDDVEDAMSYYNSDLDVTINMGQELVGKVRNRTGSTIVNGAACYVDGAQGNRPTVVPALADDRATARVAGVMTHDLANNEDGFITLIGLVRGFDTSAWVEGTLLYLSPTVPGTLTDVKPTHPDVVSQVAMVTLQHAINGWIYIKPRDLISEEAIDVSYDNTSSGLTAENVQDAIDELDTAIDAFETYPHIYINANEVMVSGSVYGVDTFAGVVTMTLPPTPSLNDNCVVLDVNQNWGTNSCFVFRNGETIDGLGEDWEGDVDSGSGTFIFDGTTWKFNPDAIGTAGLQGETGSQGDTGTTGAKGDQGLTGSQGEVGDQGIQGIQGTAGADGAKGDTGDTGPAGADGELPVLTPFALANQTYEGITMVMPQAGETIPTGRIVYMKEADQKVYLADAKGDGLDGLNRARVMGMAMTAGTLNNPITLLMQGVYRDDAWNFDSGVDLYLNSNVSTKGTILDDGSLLSSSGNVVKRIGISLEPDILYFNPQLNSVVIV